MNLHLQTALAPAGNMFRDKEKWAPEGQPQAKGWGVRCASRLEACFPRSIILSTSGYSQHISRGLKSEGHE